MDRGANCHNCVFSQWSPGQWMASLPSGFPARPRCANQPESPGRLKECPFGRVCSNFRRKPPTPTGETVMTIPVGDSLRTYVDAADFQWLNQWVWYLHGEYAARTEKGQIIFMHREIMKPPKGMVVDHKYRNKLDNTRESLRVCTRSQNSCNRAKKRGCTSRYLGVSYCKVSRKWEARTGIGGRRNRIGFFVMEVEAARAYDRKAVELAGEFARVNFPDEWPPERVREVYKGLPEPTPRRKRSGRTKRAASPRRKSVGRTKRAKKPSPVAKRAKTTRKGKRKQ